MLDAFALVHATQPHARLRIAGDGDGKPALEREARRLGNAVEFLGKRDPAELPALLAGADCALAWVPRRPWFEHQPQLKLLEALAMDLPAVTVTTAANAEAWGTLPQELLTGDSPEQFAAGMRFALERSGALRNGRFRNAAERHDWRAIARDRLLPLYAGLMAIPTAVAQRS
jgi:glycosyltransferase involved in cell wall biosynthesis